MGTLGRPAARAPINTGDIPDNIITSAKIAADVLTAADIAPNAVTTSELANDAVETLNIKDSTGASDGITTAKIATNAITTAKITALNVTAAKVASDVATTAGSQTLTNKTLTSPVVNSPTNIVKGDVGLGNVDNTTDALKPVSTAGTTALALKAPLASPVFTGVSTFPVGSKSTPSITFSGDTDTGMFRPLANELDLVTAGNTGLHIGPTGLVGIGTEGPDKLLTLQSTTANAATLRIEHKVAQAINTGPDIQFYNAPQDGGVNLYESGAIRLRKENGSTNNHDHYMSFETRKNSPEGINEGMRINSSGYISYPAQPAFAAKGFNSRTGHEIVSYDSEVFDVGNNFSNSTGRFTVPVTGRYWFGWHVGHKGFVGHMGVGLMINNSFYVMGWSDDNAYVDHDVVSGSGVFDLDQNQFVSMGAHSSYGAPNTGTDYVYFSGFLVSAE